MDFNSIAKYASGGAVAASSIGAGFVGYVGGYCLGNVMIATPGALGLTCAIMPVTALVIGAACKNFAKTNLAFSGFVGLTLTYPGSVLIMNTLGANVRIVQPLVAMVVGSVATTVTVCIVGTAVTGIAALILFNKSSPNSLKEFFTNFRQQGKIQLDKLLKLKTS